MKKIAMLRKKLTVRTLSFMMAAGLLLLIVPFVALASGKEEPNPGKKGDFRLLKGIYSTTQIDLAKEDQNDPIVTADITASSYEWQAYSSVEGKYKKFSGDRAIAVTESLAKKYDYGNGKSYFRCLATASDGKLSISDVLTVVLPQEGTSDSEPTGTEETGGTISTIELMEPTQPGETDPTEPTDPTDPAEPTVSTESTESTTQSAASSTEPTTASTQPADDDGDKVDPQDDDPVQGMLLQLLDGEEGEELPPLRGMLLEPLTEGVPTSYTVVYYVQKPVYTTNDNVAADYEVYKTEVVSNVNSGTVLDYSTQNLYGTSEDNYFTLNTNLGVTTGVVEEDGSTVIKLYYTRKNYTFTFISDTAVNGSNAGTPNIDGVTWYRSSNPYVINAKYGEDISSRWPDNGNLGREGSSYAIKSGTPWAINYINRQAPTTIKKMNGNPMYVTSSLVTHPNTQNYSYEIYWVRKSNLKYTYNYYKMDTDGEHYSFFRTTIENSKLSSHPSITGFDRYQSVNAGSKTFTINYIRNQHNLNYKYQNNTDYKASDSVYYEKSRLSYKPSDPTVKWYPDASCTGAEFDWNTPMPDHDVTVYAKREINTFTVTVHKNNPDEADPAPIANVEYGTTLSTAGVTAPTRTGYDFEGWYTDAALTSKINNWQSYQVTDNLDIYANWVIKTFVVKFYNDERVNVDDNIIISYTVEYDKTIPSYTGSDPQYYGAQPKRFDKWMYDNNGTPTEFRFGTDGTHVRENMTVYGTWINTYTVTFLKDQGLSANNPNNVQFTSDPVDENATLARPAGMTDPTKDGYTFKNEWYYDVEGTPTEFVFEGTEGKTATPITSDLIVYPAWLKNEVNLTITNNGLFDNVFKITSASPAYYLEVFVPAGQSQTVTHLPFGRYSVSASNWDFRNSYNVTNGSINASSATPGQRFDVSATSNSRGFNWLGGNASSIDNRFNPFTGS